MDVHPPKSAIFIGIDPYPNDCPRKWQKDAKRPTQAIPAWHATAMTRTKAGDSAANTTTTERDWQFQGVPKCQPLEGPGRTGINTGIMYVL
jgi:hypothetical protein